MLQSFLSGVGYIRAKLSGVPWSESLIVGILPVAGALLTGNVSKLISAIESDYTL